MARSNEEPRGNRELDRRRALMRRVFGSPDGQEVLALLIGSFGGACYQRGDSHHTAYLNGARELLLYIQDMTKEKMNG